MRSSCLIKMVICIFVKWYGCEYPPIWRPVLSLFYPPVIIRGKNGKNSESLWVQIKQKTEAKIRSIPQLLGFRCVLPSSLNFHQKSQGGNDSKSIGSNATWFESTSAPKTAPCGVLLFIFAANYAKGCKVGFETARVRRFASRRAKNAPMGHF